MTTKRRSRNTTKQRVKTVKSQTTAVELPEQTQPLVGFVGEEWGSQDREIVRVKCLHAMSQDFPKFKDEGSIILNSSEVLAKSKAVLKWRFVQFRKFYLGQFNEGENSARFDTLSEAQAEGYSSSWDAPDETRVDPTYRIVAILPTKDFAVGGTGLTTAIMVAKAWGMRGLVTAVSSITGKYKGQGHMFDVEYSIVWKLKNVGKGHRFEPQVVDSKLNPIKRETLDEIGVWDVCN